MKHRLNEHGREYHKKKINVAWEQYYLDKGQVYRYSPHFMLTTEEIDTKKIKDCNRCKETVKEDAKMFLTDLLGEQEREITRIMETAGYEKKEEKKEEKKDEEFLIVIFNTQYMEEILGRIVENNIEIDFISTDSYPIDGVDGIITTDMLNEDFMGEIKTVYDRIKETRGEKENYIMIMFLESISDPPQYIQLGIDNIDDNSQFVLKKYGNIT
jgi:hypothetical protein